VQFRGNEKMKNILITGCSGFTGSHLAEYLLKNDSNKIYGTIRGRCRQTNFIDHIKDKLTLLECDLTDYNSVQATLEDSEPDIIYHLGAQSVSADTIIPVMKSHEICLESISKLFNSYKGRYKPEIVYNDGTKTEVLNIKGKQLRALGYWNGMGTWFRIKQISRHRYHGKMMRLKQKWGILEVTPNHSIYDSMGNLCTPLDNPELLAMRNYNAYTKTISSIKLPKFKYSNDKEWIWHPKTPHIKLKIKLVGNDLESFMVFAGAYISEGCVSDRTRNRKEVIICNQDLNWINDIKDSISKFFTGRGHISKQREKSGNITYHLSYSSNVFGSITKYLFGKYSENKKMPNSFLKLGKQFRMILMDTLIKGDGSIEKKHSFDNITYTTKSKLLISQICFLFIIDKLQYTIHLDKNDVYHIREVKHYNPFDAEKKLESYDYDGYVYDISVEEVENFVAGIGFVVVHNTFVPTSWRAPQETMNTNVMGTLNLLEAIRKSKYNPKILITSSSEVYGLVKEDESPIKETNPLRPQSPYAVSKCCQDLLSYQYFCSYGMKIIRTRAFNLMGPRSGEKIVTAAFAKQIAEIEKGIREPTINVGNLDAIRDLNDIRDVVRAYDLAVKKCDYGEVYNISSGIGIKIQDVLSQLMLLSNTKVNITWNDKLMRPSDVPVLIGDSTKFRNKTGWESEYDWKTSLADILSYWRNK